MWFKQQSPYGDSSHMQISTIGLDIAKNVFQVHGIDAAEGVVVRKQLRRGSNAIPKCVSPISRVGSDIFAGSRTMPNTSTHFVKRVCRIRPTRC
jgi:hypothetical protein